MSDKAKILAVEDETPVTIMAFLLRCTAFAGSVTASACPSFFRGEPTIYDKQSSIRS